MAQVEGDLGAGAQARQGACAGLLEHAVHHRGRHAHLFEHGAQGLAALHAHHLPGAAGGGLGGLAHQGRQRQAERGAFVRAGAAHGAGEAGNDGDDQQSEEGEEAGQHPVLTRPATEGGGFVVLQRDLPRAG